MNKFFCKLPTKYIWQSLLVVILVVLVFCVGYLAWRVDDLSTRLNQIAGQQVSLASDQNHVRWSEDGKWVVFDKLAFRIPRSYTNKDMTYTARDTYTDAVGYTQDVDISVAGLPVHLATADGRISCASPVRLKFESTSNPYNPHEKNVASIKLADGRTLQVYAFTHPGCHDGYNKLSVDPVALGKSFAGAESY